MRKRIWLLIVCLFMGMLPLPTAAAEASPSVSSLSAVVYEPSSGQVLYAKDADAKRPMASTTKLMTALVAADYLAMESTVTVPAAAVAVEGSAMGLRGGDTLSVQDLMAGLLLSSGNDAANALALLTSGSLPAFAAQMNAKAAELGMSRSVFVTPSGLDEGEHGSTARDMALLGAAVLEQPTLARLCATKQATVHINGTPATLTNHNRLLWLYEDAVGMKTGFTKKSGKCLVSAAERDGVTLVVATLNGGDYWNDHMALYNYGFSKVRSTELPLPALPSVAVGGGTELSVTLTAIPPEPVVLPSDTTVTATCELPRFVWAPVAAGDRLGTLRYTANGRVVAEVPLTAEKTVNARPIRMFTEKWRRQWQLLVAAVLE